MFNWPSYAIGLAISHELTIANINWRRKLIKKVKCPLTEAIIRQGEIVDVDLFIKNIGTTFHGKSLALAIDDNWIEQCSFTINPARKKAIQYLIKQKVSPGNLYDYHLHQDQCTVWQLSKTRYQSYQLLAKKMGLTLKSIEPISCAQMRLFTQKLTQAYGIYYASTLYVVYQDKLIFSHRVLNDELEPAISLFEQLHQQKIHQVISEIKAMPCKIESDFITAYSTASRIYV